jgi:hypothetical protein
MFNPKSRRSVINYSKDTKITILDDHGVEAGPNIEVQISIDTEMSPLFLV